jgi:ketol-acid reductoisomerase
MDEIAIEAYISEQSSRTCEFAVRMTGPTVINRDEIERAFEETSRGDFAAKWTTEWQLGMFHLHRMRRTGKTSEMEKVATNGVASSAAARQSRAICVPVPEAGGA